MGKKNIVWINYLKAISIIAVFLVHSELYYGYSTGVLDHLLHPFYVNAFFFVSGYLMLQKQLSEPLISQEVGDYVIGGGKILILNIFYRIIIPSILFSAIEYVPAVVLKGEGISMSEMLYKTIGGGTYWFTSALVVAQLLYFLLLLTRKRNVLFYSAFGLVLGLVATYLITNGKWITCLNWWAYKQGIISMIFIALGGLYWRYEKQINKVFNCYVMIPLLVVYTYIVGWHYDITGCVISTFHLNALGIVMSVLICLMLPRMLRDLKSIEAITYIGKNSICFYFTSGALPIVVGIIIKRILGVHALGYILVFVICITLAYMGTYVINRWLPWILDMRLLKR